MNDKQEGVRDTPETAKINVQWDLYKASGKWAYGGVVELEVRNHHWYSDEELLSMIAANQKEVHAQTIAGRGYHAVIKETEAGMNNPDYKGFLCRMIPQEDIGQYRPNVGQVLDAVRLKQIDETNKPVELPKMPPHRTPLEIDGWDECIEAIKELGPLYTSPFGLAQKYDDVLLPFIGLMRHELHANSHKGDRRAWLCMGHNQSILEAYHHVAKLANAVRDGNLAGIREHTADVANIAMMIADIHGAWNCESEQAEHEAQALGLRS